jgi:hypothetical protein
MKSKAPTFVTAVRFTGDAIFRRFAHVRASVRITAAKPGKAKRFAPLLLLALPFVVALLPELADSTATIDTTAPSNADRSSLDTGSLIVTPRT